MTQIANGLHDAMHRIPGMPPHDSASAATTPRAATRRGANRHPHLRNPTAHHETPPRVLVAWQNRIATLVARKHS
jgi:hypothetical protein